MKLQTKRNESRKVNLVGEGKIERIGNRGKIKKKVFNLWRGENFHDSVENKDGINLSLYSF